MTEQGSLLTRHDLEAKIVKRCWKDEEFRKEFTADPAGGFIKYLAVPAADLPRIVIHEEPAGWWHIVLPLRPLNANELSEQDLEKIAGGASYLDVVAAAQLASRMATVSLATGATAMGAVVSSVAASVEKTVGW
jgi:hypothetical protein